MDITFISLYNATNEIFIGSKYRCVDSDELYQSINHPFISDTVQVVSEVAYFFLVKNILIVIFQEKLSFFVNHQFLTLNLELYRYLLTYKIYLKLNRTLYQYTHMYTHMYILPNLFTETFIFNIVYLHINWSIHHIFINKKLFSYSRNPLSY